MRVFIANIDSISKNPDTFAAMLPPADAARVPRFHNQTRKLQFILGHLMVARIGGAYSSIAHRDKWVVVATADLPVGIDIENTAIQRDFVAAAEIMDIKTPKTLAEFYQEFTLAEATYKLSHTPKCVRYITHGDYLICIASTTEFDIPELCEFDRNLTLPTEKEQGN